ncbi:MAG: peptidoglycan-binding protein [Clostridiales bacterium]|nr:peptidoglycan-binding protein [Clostridiales bacterium]
MKRIFSFLLIGLLAFPALAESADEVRLRPQWPVPDYVTRLLEVADSEVGYREGPHGYSKFGEYWGDPYAQWCAEFLCWCVDQVDKTYGTELLKNVYPLYSGQNTGMKWFIKQGRWVARNGNLDEWGYQWFKGADRFITAGEYIPQPGDWVFFSWTSDGNTSHVAMVEYATMDSKGNVSIHCVEGNNPVSVARVTYSTQDKKILGYGTVHDVADWTMRPGNNGAKVTELQEKLVYLGYLTQDSITGHYGVNTQEAINRFQTANGLKVLGIANIETQSRINQFCEEKRYQDADAWQVAVEDDNFFE